jgi:hypothetical protein
MTQNDEPDHELEQAFRELEVLVGNDREGYWTARGVIERLRPLIVPHVLPNSSARADNPQSIA